MRQINPLGVGSESGKEKLQDKKSNGSTKSKKSFTNRLSQYNNSSTVKQKIGINQGRFKSPNFAQRQQALHSKLSSTKDVQKFASPMVLRESSKLIQGDASAGVSSSKKPTFGHTKQHTQMQLL